VVSTLVDVQAPLGEEMLADPKVRAALIDSFYGRRPTLDS
jgi:hypothetical protein